MVAIDSVVIIYHRFICMYLRNFGLEMMYIIIFSLCSLILLASFGCVSEKVAYIPNTISPSNINSVAGKNSLLVQYRIFDFISLFFLLLCKQFVAVNLAIMIGELSIFPLETFICYSRKKNNFKQERILVSEKLIGCNYIEHA